MTRGRPVPAGPLFDEQPYGGVPPHQRHSDTSRAAAIAQLESATTKRATVYSYIKGAGEDGRTDDELELLTGWKGSTVRPRRCELVELGVIRDSGLKRKTSTGYKATVWVVDGAE